MMEPKTKDLDVEATLEVYRAAINERIDHEIAGLKQPMREQFRYYLGRGKRLRPILTVLWTQAYAPDVAAALRAACVIEMVHNFSLIHDDLADQDRMRRGQPTFHEEFGTQAAINVGDMMLTRAIRMMLASAFPVDPTPLTEVLLSAIEVMGIGQQRDQDLAQADLRQESYEVLMANYPGMIGAKTGALMGAACWIGARIGGCPMENGANFISYGRIREMCCDGDEVDHPDPVFQYGVLLGQAFQLTDDVLDYTAHDRGKDRGSDFNKGKKTAPILMALRRALPDERDYLLKYFGRNKLDPGSDAYRKVIGIMVKREVFGDCMDQALSYLDKSEALLPDKGPLKILKQMARNIVNRKV